MADRQVLCATDLSPASLPAWKEAQLLAGLLGARLTLLHVVAPVPIPVEGYFPPALYGELMDSSRADAARELERLAAGRTDPKLAVAGRVEDGSAAGRDRDILTGRRVEVREEAGRFDGRVRGLGAEGQLRVEDALGRIHEVVSGEVRLLD